MASLPLRLMKHTTAFILHQVDICCIFLTHNISPKVIAIIICPIVLLVGCKNTDINLSEIQTNKIEQIVSGLVEADIIFPFESTNDIPIEFYPLYLSVRYDHSKLKLNDTMQANIDYEQVMSVLCTDWGIKEISLENFDGKKKDFLITIQAGLQWKEYLINSTTIKNNIATVNVSVSRALNSIGNTTQDMRLYTHNINYYFSIKKDDIILLSSKSA
ncbi:MAG: hypothetical protein RSE07_00115 [Oscillospiraceae bacterium]